MSLSQRFSMIFFMMMILCHSPLLQADIFNATITVDGSTKNFGFSTVENVIDTMTQDFLDANFSTYTTASSLSLSIDFRGIPITLSSTAGSPTITLNIPSIGVTEVFSGSDRDASQDMLTDWLKSEGGDALNDLLKKLAELSPYDPIAGNPNSLMSNMVSSDFERGVPSNIQRQDTGINTNLISIGLKTSSFDQNGLNGRSLTLPFQYIIRIDSNPKHRIIFDIPVTYYQLEEAQTYSMKVGLGYQFPLSENWSLTPSIGTGVVGSIDLGSVGQLVSGAITSHYSQKIDRYRFGMGNMFGHYKTIKIKIGEIESDPGITNNVIRNALFASTIHPFIFKTPVETEIFIYDTRYYGDKLYMNQYNEIGLSMGTDRDRKDAKRLLRLGYSYLFSPKTKGHTLNFGYSF